MGTESSPIGRLIEEFLTASYLGHPYGQPTVRVVKGGLDVPREDGGKPTVIANAAISVALEGI